MERRAKAAACVLAMALAACGSAEVQVLWRDEARDDVDDAAADGATEGLRRGDAASDAGASD